MNSGSNPTDNIFYNVDHNIDNIVESYIIPTDTRSLLYNVRLNHDPVHVLEKKRSIKKHKY